MNSYRLEFITPLFSRGAYEDRPEVRPASIRGQLHWWFRALGGTYGDEKAIFGGVHNGAVASKIVVRVSGVQGQPGSVNTLPHKTGGQASPKAAFQIGACFDLHVLPRHGGLDKRLAGQMHRTLEAWLLLGSLGLRSTRGAGSFRFQSISPDAPEIIQPPEDFKAFEARCSKLLENSRLKFSLLNQTYPSAESARRVASDTLGGRDDRSGQDDLARLHYPLGKVFGGRKTSPLRFRVVGINNQYRIAALWDGRSAVTGNSTNDLHGIVGLLQRRKPALGEQLAAWLVA